MQFPKSVSLRPIGANMTANYPQRFKNLLSSFHGESPNNYIGQGNPGAKILIIGKECTAQNNSIGNFYTFETMQNFATWQQNCDKLDFIDVPDWDSAPLPLNEKYNPLFPYNSWVFMGGKGHGSKTWDGYQTMMNHILPPPDLRVQKGEHYNFWQHCFITELSTNNMATSRLNTKTAESINTRLNGILQHEFFQQFPIIILACYHYKDWYHIDIEQCFHQHYVDTPFDEKVGRTNEFIHRHISTVNGSRQLLLHTNHAVNYCGSGLHSEAYYEKLGTICREFLRTI